MWIGDILNILKDYKIELRKKSKAKTFVRKDKNK